MAEQPRPSANSAAAVAVTGMPGGPERTAASTAGAEVTAASTVNRSDHIGPTLRWRAGRTPHANDGGAGVVGGYQPAPKPRRSGDVGANVGPG